MKGTKEFNQKIFELFMLYNQRVMVYKERFSRSLELKPDQDDEELPLLARIINRRNRRGGRRGLPSLSLNALNKAIRDRERVFFKCFSPEGIYREHPFVKLCSELKLNRVEQKMLVCLLADYLKEALFGDFIPCSRDFEENNPLILVFPEPELAFAKTSLLSEDNKLVRFGLIAEDRFFWKRKELPELELKSELAQFLLGFSRKEFKISKARKKAELGQSNLLEIQTPKFGLDTVVLSESQRKAIDRAIYFRQSPESKRWLAQTLGYQSGSTILALFYGPPGTGKTFTAQAIAGELKKPLARVEYANLRSKWYGEAEKNLVSCFRLAEEKDAVLLFDEADALITSRERITTGATVRQVEHTLRNIFLEKIERFNGVVVLTSNLAETLDFALERRLNLKLGFSLPGVEERAKLWKKFLKKAPLAEDVNFLELGEKFLIAGGHIKNAVLSAIRELFYLRREESDAQISQSMLMESAQRECQFLEFKDETKVAGFER